MKLKKLDIIGFKSFFEKASIAFPPGICAVVGPNGCGKSNVVDALRWVMGEQSLKQLRGKNKEDIIFSGASGKPPLNMAEVSLTLVNDNGSMPEAFRDFSEVMVTRRLYRSGETAYLINKQPCRLKDIHNIFMGSGVGVRTYAVIQQGNIGAITDAGPDERRVFIEEAAGVTRYKMRKTEALRKVNATNQNLLRVKDIITEIDRQMNGLKRQAQKAARFKRLKADARQVDIRLIRHHDADLNRQMQEADALLGSLRDEDIGQTTRLKKIDAAIEAIKLRRSEKDRDIAAHKSRKFEIQRKIDRMETDLAHMKTDRERLVGEVGQLEAARSDLKAKNSTIISEIEQVRQQHETLQHRIRRIKETISRETADSSDLRARIDRLNRTLETAKNKLMEMVAEEARVRNTHQNAANNRDNLKRRLKRTDEEAVLADKAVREAGGRRETADAECRQVKNEISELDQRIAALKQELEGAIASLSAQVKTTQTMELERNKLHSSLATLRKMEANLDWYKDGVKAVLKAARQEAPPADGTARPSGIVGLLADVIDPATSYETAVEAALGESLQYILVQDHASGAGAIDYLQQTQTGRCGFIPVGNLRAVDDRPDKLPSADHRLLNHMRIKEGFESVADALLGHVVVVDDLDAARDLFDRNGRVQTVVTRGGDLLSHQGVMIGGSPDKLSGILAKKQEIKSLTDQCSRLDEQLVQAHHKQTGMEVRVRDLEKILQETISEKSHAEQDALAAEKALYRADEALKSARRHLEIVRLEQEQLMGEEMDLDEEIEGYNALLDTIARNVSEAQENVARLSASIDDTASRLEAFNQRIVDLKLELTSATANLDNCAGTLRRLKDFQSDGIRRLEQLSQDIAAKTERINGTAKRKQITQRDLGTHYAALKELESRLSTDEKAFSDIDIRLKDNDHQASQIQSQRESLHQKIRLLEMELAEKRIKRENLENRCREYYHCAIADLEADDQSEDAADQRPETLEKTLAEIRQKIVNIGDVNLEAIREFEEQKARYDFLCEQRDDLVKAIDGLHKVIRKINRITQERFVDTFNRINEKLKEVFPRLFEGGTARLELTNPAEPLETGVEFMVHPPGKKLTRMSLLSGGEKALSAISFIFSIFLLRPASFCLMDEIDAPLDDVNVMRFNNLMKVIGEKSQIIMITHNKNSMEFADTLFGITMEQKGLSKVVSVNLGRKHNASELTAA
jgi:chromosome segregation protein